MFFLNLADINQKNSDFILLFEIKIQNYLIV